MKNTVKLGYGVALVILLENTIRLYIAIFTILLLMVQKTMEEANIF